MGPRLSNSFPAQAAVPPEEGERRLYRIMLWSFFTLFPLIAMFIVTAVLLRSVLPDGEARVRLASKGSPRSG
jgi:hypothetical protein